MALTRIDHSGAGAKTVTAVLRSHAGDTGVIPWLCECFISSDACLCRSAGSKGRPLRVWGVHAYLSVLLEQHITYQSQAFTNKGFSSRRDSSAFFAPTAHTSSFWQQLLARRTAMDTIIRRSLKQQVWQRACACGGIGVRSAVAGVGLQPASSPLPLYLPLPHCDRCNVSCLLPETAHG